GYCGEVHRHPRRPSLAAGSGARGALLPCDRRVGGGAARLTVSCWHVDGPSLADPAGPMLAAGPVGAGALAPRVAADAAVPTAGHRGGRRLRTAARAAIPAGQGDRRQAVTGLR